MTESVRVSTDREILDWLTPRARGDVIVGLDAPLIVRNVEGRRPCDQLISKCFGAQDAATLSANLGLPSFKQGVRGAQLASSLSLEVDPHFEPQKPTRRAIEVYPHTAIVALSALPVTLKYKAKSDGRPSTSRAADGGVVG